MHAADAIKRIEEIDAIGRKLLRRASKLEGPDAVRVSVAVLRELRETLSMRIDVRVPGENDEPSAEEQLRFSRQVEDLVRSEVEREITMRDLVPRANSSAEAAKGDL